MMDTSHSELTVFLTVLLAVIMETALNHSSAPVTQGTLDPGAVSRRRVHQAPGVKTATTRVSVNMEDTVKSLMEPARVCLDTPEPRVRRRVLLVVMERTAAARVSVMTWDTRVTT